MNWLIVCELLLLQLLLFGFLATTASRIRWRWLKWLVWTTGLLVFLLFGLVILVDAPSQSFVRGPSFWLQMLTPAGGAPTRRMHWIGMGIGFFAFPIGLTIAALFRSRARPQTGSSAGWSAGHLAALAGVAAVAVLGTVTLNDYLICSDLTRVEQSAKQKAVSLLGPAPPADENAYVAYRRAGELAEQAQPFVEFRQETLPPDKSGHLRRKDYRLSPLELEQWQNYFQNHSEIHDLCVRAAQCEDYVPLIDDGQLWDTDKEADGFRSLGRFLKSQGHFQLSAGTSAEAYSTAAVMRRTAEHLFRDRRLIVVLLAYAFSRDFLAICWSGQSMFALRRQRKCGPSSEQASSFVPPCNARLTGAKQNS